MKRVFTLCALALILTMAPAAYAAELSPSPVCYPVSTTRSEDGTEIRKVYDLSPEEDPAGIARSDFEQEGFHYTLVDLLRQESPEYEERFHTETVSIPSKSKDMESVLALLPAEREFVTEDGLTGTLALQLDTVQVEVSGYGSSTKEVSTTRSYPNLASQDTANIPKRIDYSGTVSRITLNKTRYVAIFEGTPLKPMEPEPDPAAQAPTKSFSWPVLLVPLGVIAAAGTGVGGALFLKRRRESMEESE